MSEVCYACKKCKTVNKRKVEWIDPTRFTSKKSAFMKKMFWCDQCGVSILLELRFKKDGVIKITKEIPISVLENRPKNNDLVLSSRKKQPKKAT